MKKFRFLAILVAGAALALTSGCSAFNAVREAAQKPVVEVVDLKTAQQRAFQLKAGYATALTGAQLYAELPRCGTPAATSKPVCSSQAVLDAMVKLSRSADVGTQALEDVVRGTPNDASLLTAAVASAEASFTAFKKIVDIYKPKGA